MTALVQVVTCNALKTLDEEAATKLADKVLAAADVVLWQELRVVHKRVLRSHRNWAHYFPKDGPWGVGISWRADRFTVYRGGRLHRVIPGIKRVDPARGFLDVVLQDRFTGQLWPVLSAHLTHQAFSSHPERRPRWRAVAIRLRLRSRRLARKFDRVVGGGDMNRHQWAPGGTFGVWATKGTYHSRKYDTLWYRGQVDRKGVARTIATPSDHHALGATFRAV